MTTAYREHTGETQDLPYIPTTAEEIRGEKALHWSGICLKEYLMVNHGHKILQEFS